MTYRSETPPVNGSGPGAPKPSNGHSAVSHLQARIEHRCGDRCRAYAAVKGFSVRFGSEDLRAMALSLFIQHARDGGVR